MALQIGETAPDFEAETNARSHPLPPVAQRRMGRAVLAP